MFGRPRIALAAPATHSLDPALISLVVDNMDADMMEMMGISGFGKQKKQKQLDPHRFDKDKRVEVRSTCQLRAMSRTANATRCDILAEFRYTTTCKKGR